MRPYKAWSETTCDIYLNNTAYWKNVPVGVWEYTIGGYQVIKKWLSYRERDLLGRSLTIDEAREVTNIARRIAAILLVEPELDANYQVVKQALSCLASIRQNVRRHRYATRSPWHRAP